MLRRPHEALTRTDVTRILALKRSHSVLASHITEALDARFEFNVVDLDAHRDIYKHFSALQCIVLFLTQEQYAWVSCVQYLKQHHPDLPIIALFDDQSRSFVNMLMEESIDDVLSLDTTGDEVVERIEQLVKHMQLSRLKKELFVEYCREKIIGASEVFLKAIENIPQISLSNSPVLISGETGVGKELCARGIHYMGERRGQPFVPVNCGALHEHLFEDELFGHVKGAYTGAVDTRRGLIHAAQGGTLFLDEINTLSQSAQVKLLRFLEDKKYNTLGSSTFVEADVRLISATNVKLEEAVTEGKFREDLFYRIQVLNIDLPPLRDRGDDILLLAHHFLENFSHSAGRSPMMFSDTALAKLSTWHWPGNTRELRNVIERAVTTCSSSFIRAEDIYINGQTKENCCDELIPYREARKIAIQNFERNYFTRILRENEGNVSNAAKQAQHTRRHFYRLIQKYGLL